MTTETKPGKKTIEVFLVEDNPAEISLMKELLKITAFNIRVTVASDGEKALETIRRPGNFPRKGKPDLVLLDLNLPKIDGRKVLTEIKSDPGLRDIPVLVLTGSKADEDIITAYENQASLFIVKPMDMDHFTVLVKHIEQFWLKGMA